MPAGPKHSCTAFCCLSACLFVGLSVCLCDALPDEIVQVDLTRDVDYVPQLVKFERGDANSGGARGAARPPWSRDCIGFLPTFYWICTGSEFSGSYSPLAPLTDGESSPYTVGSKTSPSTTSCCTRSGRASRRSRATSSPTGPRSPRT